METGIVSGARSHWYDRSLNVEGLYYGTALGPHAVTTRDLYTVPVGGILFIPCITLSLTRLAIASTVGQVNISVRIKNAGGTTIAWPFLTHADNTLNSFSSIVIPVRIRLPVDYELSVLTEDTGIEGSIYYKCTSLFNLYNQ